MFAIKCTKGKEIGNYVAIDRTSGGYLYWSSLLRDARMYSSIEDAKKSLESFEWTRETRMSDGSIDPPLMLYVAAGLCNMLKSNDVEISIVEIKDIPVETIISKTVSIKTK